MRVPLSWLREYVDLPATETGRDVQAKLISAGLEVETVEHLGADLKGPLVVGQVLTIEELEGFKKPIRFCTVDVGQANGTGEPQEIVCGARNFSVGDKVVVVLPGATLPGGFSISARKTYGKTSHGMICSSDELGMGDDGTHGIIVLPPETEVGKDAIELLELVDEVLDIAVTANRGDCLSIRGVARETAIAYGLPLRDPALLDVPAPNAYGYPVKIADPSGCDRFTARTVTGLSAEARSPIWLQRRLQKVGMRPISLAVDVTNYVMMELGQPLHAYDRSLVQGTIGVRRAEEGEKIVTLDGVERKLHAEDLVITDDRGPIGLAGVMGGANTEIADHSDTENATSDVVIEAAHFDQVAIARTARRHKLSSEASRRFERGVDPQAAAAAAQRTVDLLVLLAGGTAEAGVTEISAPPVPHTITVAADHPDKVAGVTYGRETVVRRLQEVGCDVYGQDELIVTAPSWRPDLTDPNDLAEEVIRLEGYENLPSTLPRPRRAAASPPVSGCAAGSAVPWPVPVTSRRRTTRSSASRSSTSSAWTPTTRTAASSSWSTRSATRSPRCGPRCCRACSAPCAATTAAARTTWPSSRRAWSSTRATSSASPPTCPWTVVPARTTSPRWTPRCPTSRGTSPSSWPAPASRPAGGARAVRPTGPTRSSPPGRWPARPVPNWASARVSTGPGTRAAAPSCSSRWTARSASSDTPVSCTRAS